MFEIAGAVIGGVLGLLYYKKVGCPTGSCPITSSPYCSTLYGAIMGMLIGSFL
ncbi:MAG: YtxH domain-containing protein [Oscillospiraceae bacterium]|jgi:outer membrane lipoprotein SlyB